jgi:hypothetical protein
VSPLDSVLPSSGLQLSAPTGCRDQSPLASQSTEEANL